MALNFVEEEMKGIGKKEDYFIEKFGVERQEMVFLKKAAESLKEHKRVLMWSYCLGYFLQKSKKEKKKETEMDCEEEEQEENQQEMEREEEKQKQNKEREEEKEKEKEYQLFEFLQENLEKYSNHLSQLYEKDLQLFTSSSQFIEWKESVTTNTIVTNNYLQNFIEGVKNGFTSQF